MGLPKSLAERVTRAKTLLGVLKPTGTGARPNYEYEQALDHESLVWLLVQRQHDALWKDGARNFGRSVEERVPALGSRTVGRHAAPVVPGTPDPASEE